MLRREREQEAGIKTLPGRARDTDVQEDERFGGSFRGDELPEELCRREDRLAAKGIWRRSNAGRTRPKPRRMPTRKTSMPPRQSPRLVYLLFVNPTTAPPTPPA